MSTPGTAVGVTEEIDLVQREFAGAQLGDQRLNRRLSQIVGALWESPDQGFPQAMPSEAEAEGFYRFMVNPRIDPQALLTPHLEATATRAARFQEVLAIHDTTQFDYSTPREGLGRVSGNRPGFLLHASLLLSDPLSRTPLGLGTVLPWVRTGAKTSRTASGQKVSGAEYAKLPNRESRRWLDCVERVEERITTQSPTTSVIHVGDREGDSYEFLSQLVAEEYRFAFRVSRDRMVEHVDEMGDLVIGKLRQVVGAQEALCQREVNLSRRVASSAPRSAHSHGTRKGRVATLAFAAQTVTLRRPERRTDLPETTQLNVVYVREIDPPEGEERVEWLIATSEPIDGVDQILRVVDIYRARWVIEEYFKALKTGCRLEERQLESYEGLLRAFSLFAPIAWQMLRLRALSRTAKNAPATEVLAPSQLAVLKQIAKRPLSAQPTVDEALLAIARLGGHLQSNGAPGWLTIARGMAALAQAHIGWVACRAAMAAGLEM